MRYPWEARRFASAYVVSVFNYVISAPLGEKVKVDILKRFLLAEQAAFILVKSGSHLVDHRTFPPTVTFKHKMEGHPSGRQST